MADTVVSNNRFIDITGADGSTAIAEDHSLSVGQLYSITFIPGGAGDKLVIKDRNASGPIIAQITVAAATDLRQLFFNGRSATPFLDVSAGSFTAGARVLLHHET